MQFRNNPADEAELPISSICAAGHASDGVVGCRGPQMKISAALGTSEMVDSRVVAFPKAPKSVL